MTTLAAREAGKCIKGNHLEVFLDTGINPCAASVVVISLAAAPQPVTSTTY